MDKSTIDRALANYQEAHKPTEDHQCAECAKLGLALFNSSKFNNFLLDWKFVLLHSIVSPEEFDEAAFLFLKTGIGLGQEIQKELDREVVTRAKSEPQEAGK